MKVKTKAGRKKRKEAVMGYLFAAPWLIGFVVLMAFPLFYSLFYQRNNHVHKHAVAGDFVLQNDIGGSGVLGECQQHTEICPPQRAA